MTTALLTQVAVEALTKPPSTARLTQVAVEALTKPPSAARITQVAVEVLWGAHIPFHESSGALLGGVTAITGTAARIASGIPILSSATVIDIGTTQATPQVVLTF